MGVEKSLADFKVNTTALHGYLSQYLLDTSTGEMYSAEGDGANNGYWKLILKDGFRNKNN